MNAETANWRADSVCLQPTTFDAQLMARAIYDRTCRTDFSSPGFCVANLGQSIGSVAFRTLMVEIKCHMATIHEATTGRTLAYRSAARFDQQETTRPHLDGGPNECFLMLGYEPTLVQSKLELFDYSKCAFQMGISPQEFLAKYNPMFAGGYELLRDFATPVPCLPAKEFNIVCNNNSSAAFSETEPVWQGVLHTATILTPNEAHRRIINSTMIAPAEIDSAAANDADVLGDFVTTSIVRRRGYDKQHLNDDR